MSVTWNAEQYAKFSNERTRPAGELLARVALQEPTSIADLGCGPGNSTVLLKDRWRKAHVVGIDNSGEMLAAAHRDHPNLTFINTEISQWQPQKPVDLIFSNAALQWVPHHSTLLPRLAALLSQQGAIAIQVPNNHHEATHAAMRTIATGRRWSVNLAAVRNESLVLKPQSYYNILAPHFKTVDIWETRYFHVMDGCAAIAEWLQGTGLRPFLEPLPKNEQNEFLTLYVEKLNEIFEKQTDGKVMLPFPRLFIVAHR